MLNPILVTWLLAFFSFHATPAPRCVVRDACTAVETAERDDFQTVRLETSNAALAVAYDPSEPPLFKGEAGRAQTATLLAAIGAHETGLQPRLVRGNCRPGKECDGGKAVGVMQIHPGDYGIELTGVGYRMCEKRDVGRAECVGRAELLADPVLTQRVALHMLRQTGLEVYTGEGVGAAFGGPADELRGWVRDWLKAHPAPISDAMALEHAD